MWYGLKVLSSEGEGGVRGPRPLRPVMTSLSLCKSYVGDVWPDVVSFSLRADVGEDSEIDEPPCPAP